MNPTPWKPPLRKRSAFTLIELLVVIVIIAILAGLLMPVIGSAIRKANEASVQAEINQMATALAAFKDKYGDYPPSRVLLCEDGYYDTSSAAATATSLAGPGQSDITAAQLAQRSLSYLRKFWPRAVFSTTGPVFAKGTYPCYDFNGDGAQAQAPYILRGQECLVFFLGGLPGSGGGTVGFSRNPQNPFLPPAIAGNRQAPLFDFKADRLVMTTPGAATPGIPGYRDPLKTDRFYAYFSAYGGNGYDPNDVNFDNAANTTPQGTMETDNGGLGPITLAFKVPFPVMDKSGAVQPLAASAAPNPYTSTVATGLDPTATPPRVVPVVYHNPNTFQILSAGVDAEYGVGGQYLVNAPLALPGQPGMAAAGSAISNVSIRIREKDNLTNFKNGRLD